MSNEISLPWLTTDQVADALLYTARSVSGFTHRNPGEVRKVIFDSLLVAKKAEDAEGYTPPPGYLGYPPKYVKGVLARLADLSEQPERKDLREIPICKEITLETEGYLFGSPPPTLLLVLRSSRIINARGSRDVSYFHPHRLRN